MKRHDRLLPNAPHARGFSLIEVLVVIGLIAFLTAAIVVIMPRVGNAAKVSATQATMKKVDELLNDRINGFVRWIQTQNTQAGNNPPAYVTNAGYGTTQYQQNPALYQILGAKYFFRKYFPQTFAEMTPAPTYNASVHKPVTESAACLYLILTQAGVFDTDPLQAADLRGLELADTDGDGLMEIVDAWGQPLRYYRWPTRLFRPATSSGSVGTPGWNNLEPGPAPTPASILISTATRGPRPKCPMDPQHPLLGRTECSACHRTDGRCDDVSVHRGAERHGPYVRRFGAQLVIGHGGGNVSVVGR
jgi:prepilin-type N-terminal cleavage/methylation domain-containing protein